MSNRRTPGRSCSRDILYLVGEVCCPDVVVEAAARAPNLLKHRARCGLVLEIQIRPIVVDDRPRSPRPAPRLHGERSPRRDRLEGLDDHVETEADRTGEVRIGDKEIYQDRRADLEREEAPVHSGGPADSKEGEPVRLGGVLAGRKDVQLSVDEPGEKLGPLDVAAES